MFQGTCSNKHVLHNLLDIEHLAARHHPPPSPDGESEGEANNKGGSYRDIFWRRFREHPPKVLVVKCSEKHKVIDGGGPGDLQCSVMLGSDD
jgi:hypothetical protein